MWIDKYHIVRRSLLYIYSGFYLRITYRMFCEGIPLDVFKVSAYVTFTGIITFMLKFYFNSRDKEIKK